MVSIAFSGLMCNDTQQFQTARASLGPTIPLAVSCTTRKLSCGAARNVAVGRCGENMTFLKFADADDEYMPNMLARMVQLMDEHDATIGYHGYFPKHSGPVVRDDASLRERIRGDGGRWKSFSPFSKLQTQHGQPMVLASAFVPFDTHDTRREDTQWAREQWLNAEQRFVHTREPLTIYTARPRAAGEDGAPRRRRRRGWWWW
jgi:hypothetical protein